MGSFRADSGNQVDVPHNLDIRGFIHGKQNKISVGDVELDSTLTLSVYGNNNTIKIDSIHCVKNMHLKIGVRENILSNNCSVNIGSNFWSEDNLTALLYNHTGKLTIGNNCIFSNNITIRLGDRPHLLFDIETCEYIDESKDGVIIGNDVWVGERVYITKKAQIADGSVAAVNSVVTRKFDKKNCILGGNPAKIVRTGVKWIRNSSSRYLDTNSEYKHFYDEYERKHTYE